LKIIVCVKQVPDSAAKVIVEDGQVTWGDSPLVINPWDEYAVETALLQQETHGGDVTVVSVGDENAKEALKHALAMGCNEAILITDPALTGADSLVVSQILAAATQKIGDVDAVFFGKQAIDGDTAQVGPGIATRLGIPQLTYVSKIKEVNLEQKKIVVERLLEHGREVVESSLPTLITVVKDINEPRLPSLLGIKKAAKAQIPTLTAKDIGADENRIGLKGSPTWVTKVFSPEARGGSGEILKGELGEVVPLLVNKLMDTKLIK